MRRRSIAAAVAGATLVLVLGGCADDATQDPPASAPAGPAVAGSPTGGGVDDTASPRGEGTTPVAVIELGPGTIAGLDVPLTPEEVRETLVPVLGEPEVDEERAGCPGVGPDARQHVFTWDDLTLTGTWSGDDAPRITSWAVRGQNLPERVGLPSGIFPGSSWDEARESIPDVREDADPDSLGGLPYLTTTEEGEPGGLVWMGDAERVEITDVFLNRTTCA